MTPTPAAHSHAACSLAHRQSGRGDLPSFDAAGLAVSPVPKARQVADAAVAGWNAVAEALVPIIGRSSVTDLYRRCLISVGVDRTWLPSGTASDGPSSFRVETNIHNSWS